MPFSPSPFWYNSVYYDNFRSHEHTKFYPKDSIAKKTDTSIRDSSIDIAYGVQEALHKHSNKTLYVFAIKKGYRIQTDPPIGLQPYVRVGTDNSVKVISWDDRYKEQSERYEANKQDQILKEKAVADKQPVHSIEANKSPTTGRRGVTIRSVPDSENKPRKERQKSHRFNPGRTVELGADIVRSRRGRHLKAW
jgi:hypothetical protein